MISQKNNKKLLIEVRKIKLMIIDEMLIIIKRKQIIVKIN
jgi:hypothetical protein